MHQLVDVLGLPLNRDAAVCLYAALVCDTGRFQYDTTTPAVFELARELVAVRRPGLAPVPHAVRGAPVRVPQAARRGARAARSSSAERRFVWTAVTQGHARSATVTIEEVEGLIDILRRTAEAEVTCVLKEEADGTVRVSLRSLGDGRRAQHRRGRRAAAATASPPASARDDGVDAVVGADRAQAS